MEKPTKENTLYLTIKQTFFDQIAAGTKDKEYREIKDSTYKKYLACDENGAPYFDTEKISIEEMSKYGMDDIFAWNNGVYPLVPNNDIYFLNLAVGYAKERDTMLVEVEDFSFEPLLDKTGKPARFDENGINENGPLCFWQIVFHLGKIVELNRKK